MEFRHNHLSHALSLALLSVKMEGRLGNLPGLGQGLHLVGKVYLMSRRFERAARHFHRAISLQRDVGDLMSLAATYNNLGVLAVFEGKPELAKAAFRDAIARSEGDPILPAARATPSSPRST